MALTRQRHKFVEEYLACWCGAEAARRAGYSARTAGVLVGFELIASAIATWLGVRQ